jgi:hypothetical protein
MALRIRGSHEGGSTSEIAAANNFRTPCAVRINTLSFQWLTPGGVRAFRERELSARAGVSAGSRGPTVADCASVADRASAGSASSAADCASVADCAPAGSTASGMA